MRDGVIKEPVRIFAPGFGAGAVAGYCVMRIDPAVVAIAEHEPHAASVTGSEMQPPPRAVHRQRGDRLRLDGAVDRQSQV